MAFQTLKAKLLSAPALVLPNLEKAFTLYVEEKESQALRVLTQKLGNGARPVGCFSKSLDNVAQGWLACLRAVAATALLVEEVSKFTMGQSLTGMTSCQVQSVLETTGHQWMTGGCLTKYQAMLLDTPEIILKTCQTLNPATLMPGPDHRISIEHNCSENTDPVSSSRPDLRDPPIKNAGGNWFTDGSSFMEKGGGKRLDML